MTRLKQILLHKELWVYTFIGGLATIIDWCVFAMCIKYFNLHYQLGVITAYGTAGVFHYIFNKIFTFACQSKQYGAQIALYGSVVLLSLLCNMLIMTILVHFLQIDKLFLRMITTGLMLLPNYVFHKYITFNKKIFL